MVSTYVGQERVAFLVFIWKLEVCCQILRNKIFTFLVEADMDELLQDKDFLQSTFAALPGVNPDEVLQMMQEEQDQQMEGNDDDESKKNKDVQKGK